MFIFVPTINGSKSFLCILNSLNKYINIFFVIGHYILLIKLLTDIYLVDIIHYNLLKFSNVTYTFCYFINHLRY